MKNLFIDKEIKYTGKELFPHWIYKNFALKGSAVVAFVGPVDVKVSELVDIEDVIQNDPIASDKMLNFIIEDFECSFETMISNQRLFICILKETLESNYDIKLTRTGDDLFYNSKKLSVSIATKSITSNLIHTALNIAVTGTPIPVSSLEEIGVVDVKAFATVIMERFCFEIEDMKFAKAKVRGVS